MSRTPRKAATKLPRHGIARVLSKLGMASRTKAAQWVADGRVRVNGQIVHDPEFPVWHGKDSITVDALDTVSQTRCVIMLNKPRGLLTTTHDERGRATVYTCLAGCPHPWLAPVGRLDKASEGLLLFSNDPVWAARITQPTAKVEKIYHVQVDQVPDSAQLASIAMGARVDDVHLAVKAVRLLRRGTSNAWLEIKLDEGHNRHIRRLLMAFDLSVLRLVRVAIGPLVLGSLPKGRWRELSAEEMDALANLPHCKFPPTDNGDGDGV